MANFFWGDTQGKNKHHWLKWSDLCYPTKEGGMGFKSIQNSCDAFAAKNWWNFRTGNSLLKSFLEAKYCKRLHPVARKGRPDQSHTWRRLMNIKDKCETHMIWKIGKGNLSFWWNNWSGKGSIAKHLHLVHKSKNTKVAEFIREGKWDESHLRLELPANIVDDIMKIQIHKDQYDKIISDSFKVAFFMMKLLRSRISTDENVRRFKVHGPSMCNCCISHQEESIQHLFVEGDIARLWKTFGNSCGIKFNNGSIRTVVMQWWLTKTKNKIQETMYQCLPTVFCWEIWKRVDAMLDLKEIKSPLTELWNRWLFGERQQVGEFLRDYQGNMRMAFHAYLGVCSNNMAEGLAIMKGLQWCATNHFHNVIVESDSMIMVNMIRVPKNKLEAKTMKKKEVKETRTLQVFSFDEMKEATNNFSVENELGKGGYGPVYKGKLRNGKEIAVKRLSETSSQGLEEFENEVIRVYQAVQQVLQAVQQVHDHSHVAKLGSYKNSKICSCK
ncbi:hypothetical protein FXO37_13978 [Capsicum annuum]|nr:hypothetical protein FXO37_13978 [Capsicum annuum]